MSLDEVADDVFVARTGLVNWLLVREGRHVLAIDSGYPAAAEEFMRSVTRVGGMGSQLTAAIITHGHADHQGGLAEARPRVPIYAHRDELGNARRDVLHQVNARALGARLLAPRVAVWAVRAIRHGGLRHCPVPAVAPHGGLANLPGAPRIIHSPGHTPGHVAVAIDDRRVLATGDALISEHPCLPRRDHVRGGELPAHFHSDPCQASVSASRLRGAASDYLHVPGHGAPYVLTV
ncbi:MBL fold metallo-hydrolase [Isoptericola sp. F-RaC21]|uniref:MBL fold metallo-hydrolase n=1 Tax=Isoptericola sp. F-RaC21 TaxID=3141452 RepID=UPI00315BA638